MQSLERDFPRKIDLSLERIKSFLFRIGNPEAMLPPVVHVAGTNGKGSTIAFMRSIMESAGLRVHVYTSPHLVEFNERIVLAGKEISDDYLYELLRRCEEAAESSSLTFFELITAAAFLAFSEIPGDILLLETGLGGRLDATNVIERPVATLITPISLDHAEFLGGTLKEIASEKAGIIKPGVKCIVAEQPEEALAEIERVAAEQRAPLSRAGKEWRVEALDSGIEFISQFHERHLPFPVLAGRHQVSNAGAAIACVTALPGFDFNNDNIAKGLEKARWPGRLHKLSKGRLVSLIPNDFELWLDGAHNEGGAEALAGFMEAGGATPYHIIMGMLKSKDAKGFLARLKGRAESFYFVAIPEEENSRTPAELASVAEEAGISGRRAASVEEAIVDIVVRSGGAARIMICGSLYLAGKILEENG